MVGNPEGIGGKPEGAGGAEEMGVSAAAETEARVAAARAKVNLIFAGESSEEQVGLL